MVILSSTARGAVSLPVQLVGQWGGHGMDWLSREIELMSAWAGSLVVMNISDPSQPVKMGRCTLYDGGITAIAISGNYVYVTGYEGLQILDVSNPSRPVRIGGCFLAGGPLFAVAVSGTYAYAADLFGWISVVNVSDPTGPFLVGICATYTYEGCPTNPRVTVSGHDVYVTNDQVGFAIIDVSSPANPHEVGQYGAFSTTCSAAVSGNFAYVSMDDGLHTLDVSDPANPREVGYYRN